MLEDNAVVHIFASYESDPQPAMDFIGPGQQDTDQRKREESFRPLAFPQLIAAYIK